MCHMCHMRTRIHVCVQRWRLVSFLCDEACSSKAVILSLSLSVSLSLSPSLSLSLSLSLSHLREGTCRP